MTLAQSLIQFGDYIMPIGTKLKSRQIDSTIENTPLLGLDGEYAPPGRSLGASVDLVIDMGGGGDVSPTAPNNPLITLDDLNDEANRLLERLQSGYQNLILGTTPARYAVAQKRKASAEYGEGSYRSHATITLELYAPDPRSLSSVLNTVTFTPNQQIQITNAGTARSYPVFTLTNNTAPIKVLITAEITGGGGGVEIDLNYTPVAGDTVVIDCDPANRANAVLLNGTPRLDLLGTSGIRNTLGTADMFPFLTPGNANFAWFGVGNAIQGTLQWRDAWVL